MRLWLAGFAILLVPAASGATAQFLLEDPADDNGIGPQGTDLLSMLVEADGTWVNLTMRLDGFPIVKTQYQLDVMPVGWQVYATCEIAPVDGPLTEGSTCEGARLERRSETMPGPAVVEAVYFDVQLTLQPDEEGFRVTMPYDAFIDVKTTPVEVVRATSGNGVTVTESFVYPDRADIARAETEWWMPLLAEPMAQDVPEPTVEQSDGEEAGALGFVLALLALVWMTVRRRQ